MSGIRKIVVDVPSALYDQFREELDDRGESTAFVIKNLIRSWLVEVEHEPKQSFFRRAAVESKKVAKRIRRSADA